MTRLYAGTIFGGVMHLRGNHNPLKKVVFLSTFVMAKRVLRIH